MGWGRAARTLSALMVISAAAGCVPVSGVASLSVLSRSQGTTTRLQPFGDRVKHSECTYWAALFVVWGHALTTHESALERVLEETGADALIDAQFYNEQWGVPLVFLMTCATVEGQPAKAVKQ